MSDRRHAKLGIFQLTGVEHDETTNWRATKHSMIKGFGADRPSLQPRKRLNWGLLAALLINALLWAGIYWVVTSFF
ncbi:hypothetical protein XH88_08690 [Bradyrhizobium sp. CCBAU 51627]|nr:hypothetical protein [Bradyrhizobium sp. CCBAU 51627]